MREAPHVLNNNIRWPWVDFAHSGLAEAAVAVIHPHSLGVFCEYVQVDSPAEPPRSVAETLSVTDR